MKLLKKIIKTWAMPILDIILSPFTIICAFWLKLNRRAIFSGSFMPCSKKIFKKVGVFPIMDHYYEPLFNEKHLKESLRKDRELPAVNFNISGQLDLLNKFNYNDELLEIPKKKTNDLEFYYENSAFGAGSADFLYNMVRYFKPHKIIEVGCGNSTLMIRKALDANTKKDINYSCEHLCIEPYEMPWLEQLNIKIIRSKVEDVDMDLFKSLKENDILFIDSSHMIRPQGDVLTEYLKILPNLNKGVLIHIHDIFTPKDYLSEWILKEKRLWNEQYLLEAFLSYNNSFEIIGALNYLHHNHYEKLSSKCPLLTKEREPGSFWLKKIL